MYNNTEVSQFGSAETKLKQLYLKLREAEQAQARMRIESTTLKKHLSSVKNIVPEDLADRLCEVLVEISKDALDNMDEHIRLRD